VSNARYIIGDTRDVTATMPDNSVDLVLTSPPFLALRSYLPADHPDKHREIGSEPDPAAFIDMLLALTAEWDRVLTPTGSICVELGDTYSGSGGAGGDYLEGGWREGQQQFSGSAATMRESNAAHWRQKNSNKDAWPLAKSKALIPELYRVALAYGINPLTGQPSPAGRWRVRNVVTWCRPNPPVGALGDKYRPATSDMVIACRASNRWFDLDAVRGPASPNTHARVAKNGEARHDLPSQQRDGNWNTLAAVNADPTAGAPPLDYWVIPPTGYAGSHYAVYPPELCRIPILSMCPQHVCTTCGEPRRRIVEVTGMINRDGKQVAREVWASGIAEGKAAHSNKTTRGTTTTTTTLGWTDCGHGTWRNGIVFDPFAGSGTTLAVASGLGRDSIGIDIDHRNADLARERVGMFLTVEDRRVTA